MHQITVSVISIAAPSNRMSPVAMSTTKIAALRKERGMTQKDLARRLKPKTSDVQISRLESEDRRLTLAWMRRIAAALKVRVSELLPDEDVAPRSSLALDFTGNLTIQFNEGRGMTLTEEDIVRMAKLWLKHREAARASLMFEQEITARTATE
jgi:transcriptional regulator with XRE-family HTH domain